MVAQVLRKKRRRKKKKKKIAKARGVAAGDVVHSSRTASPVQKKS